jgi:hypothetical protein
MAKYINYGLESVLKEEQKLNQLRIYTKIGIPAYLKRCTDDPECTGLVDDIRYCYNCEEKFWEELNKEKETATEEKRKTKSYTSQKRKSKSKSRK